MDLECEKSVFIKEVKRRVICVKDFIEVLFFSNLKRSDFYGEKL